MANNIFKKSEKFSSEYCCSIVKIGEVKPIKGKDKIGYTLVNGETIVVRKDQVKEGDILFYASNETQLDKDFLGDNNLFESSCYELNANAKEVEPYILKNKELKSKLLTNDIEKEIEENNTFIRSHVGFFNKTGRVRAIRLGGVQSMGYLFSLDELIRYNINTKGVNLEELVGEDFDTIEDTLFIKAYVPFVPQRGNSKSKDRKRNKKIEKFDRMIKGEFSFHYSTDPLPKCINRVKPDDVVTITSKLHGTSICIGKLHVKTPIKLPFHKWIWNKFVDLTGLFKTHRITDYVVEYGNVTSSRTVIKNQYINKGVTDGYYGVDVWSEYGNLLYPYLTEGMTIYGEIIGYCTGSDKMIQKGYDYGCEKGENKLMIYRITTTNENGTKSEWNVTDVHNWTQELIKEHPEIADRIHVIDLLYHGTLANLYPDIALENHWHENVLEAMRNDKKHFYMEKNDPICHNKVPFEGIVLRIDDDELSEAFKLKCQKFLSKEREEIDKGEVDMEMTDAYVS